MAATKKTYLVRRSDGTRIIDKCHTASTLTQRLIGLLTHTSLDSQGGLLIQPCKQVHTLFLRFAIDVIFLDRERRIVAIESLKPWRISGFYWRAADVLELSYGAAVRARLQPGDQLEFETCSN